MSNKIKKGVEVLILMIEWSANGEAKFVTFDLPINL